MTRTQGALARRIRELVVASAARHLGVPSDKLRLSARLHDPAIFYRVLVDIEGELDVRSSEGNWSFDGDTLSAIVDYFVNLIRKRSEHGLATAGPNRGAAGDGRH